MMIYIKYCQDSVSDKGWKMGAQKRYFRCFMSKEKNSFCKGFYKHVLVFKEKS